MSWHSVMRFTGIMALGAMLGGCALPLPIQVASYALDGISLLTTSKSLTEHGVSAIVGKDCAVLHGLQDGEFCTEIEGATVAGPIPSSPKDAPITEPRAAQPPPLRNEAVDVVSAPAPPSPAPLSPAPLSPAPLSPAPGTQVIAPAPGHEIMAIHLASYQSEVDAAFGWQMLRWRHQGLLGNLRAVIRRIDHGDSGYSYQIIVTPQWNSASAATLCLELEARQQFCRISALNTQSVSG